MIQHYSHPEAHNRTGRSFGLTGVDRLSELSLVTGRTIEWHAHDETELICCLRGSLEYEFRDRLGVTVTSGCFLVIPKRLQHRLVGGVDAPCRRLSVFLSDRPCTTTHEQVFSRGEYRNLLADILHRRLCPRAIPHHTLPDLTRVADLTAKSALMPRERVELRLRTASALLSLAAERPPEVVKPQVRLIDEATRWLEDHYAEKVTLGQLTAFMGYSPSRLCELFKARTGLPPLEWLIRFRIEKACAFLKDEKLTVIETAKRVGFNNPSFFSRVFHRRIGLSPTAFRTQHATP